MTCRGYFAADEAAIVRRVPSRARRNARGQKLWIAHNGHIVTGVSTKGRQSGERQIKRTVRKIAPGKIPAKHAPSFIDVGAA